MKKYIMLALTGFLILAVIVVIGGFFGGKLPPTVRSQYRVEQARLIKLSGEFETRAKYVRETVQAKDYLTELDKTRNWIKGLETLEARFKEARTLIDGEGKKLYDRDREEDAARLTEILGKVETLRSRVLEASIKLHGSVKGAVFFKENREQLLKEAKENHDAIERRAGGRVASTARKASKDFKDKAGDIQTRLAALTTTSSNAGQWLTSIQTAAGKTSFDDVNIDEVVKSSENLARNRKELETKATDLEKKLDELYYSRDKVLVDLEKRTGSPSYFAKYKTYKITKNRRKPEITEEWVSIPRAEFVKSLDLLGMSVEFKPMGKYESETKKVATPFGFHYVNNPDFGEWVNDKEVQDFGGWDEGGGGSFGKKWKFNKKYAYIAAGMGLGGLALRKLTKNMFTNFKVRNKAGRAFFGGSGKLKKFGTDSIGTRSLYKKAKYVASGSYLTYRAAMKPRTSYGSSSYRGYRSGGSSGRYGK